MERQLLSTKFWEGLAGEALRPWAIQLIIKKALNPSRNNFTPKLKVLNENYLRIFSLSLK